MLNINEMNRIHLGNQGENLAQEITINVHDWLVDYPNGTITIWHKRNGDSVPAPTGATLDRSHETLTWQPTSTDTYVAGEGEAEIRLTENNVIKKSRKLVTCVSSAVTLAGEALGSGWQDYVVAVEGMKNTASGYADDAEDSAEDAEAYATGTRGGTPVTSDDPAYHNNAEYFSGEAADSATAASGSATDASGYADDAEDSAEDAEAWAKGTRGGTPVTSDDPAYHNNADYFKGAASSSATAASSSASAAAGSATDAEAWAKGTRGGTPVTSDDPAYHNNADYFKGEASTSATAASGSATAAAGSATDAEAWAKGTRGGTPVTSDDPTYNKHAKYYAEEAQSIVEGIIDDTAGAGDTDSVWSADKSYSEVSDLKSALNAKIQTKVDKSGIKQIAPSNLQILNGYENLLNPNTFTDGKILYADGRMDDKANYHVSDYIPVVPGETYIYVARQTPTAETQTTKTRAFRTYAYYDAQKNVTSGGSNTATDTPITIPDGVYYLRFCVTYAYQYMLLTNGSVEKPYIAYGEDTYIIDDHYLPDYHDFVTLDELKKEKEWVGLSNTTFSNYSKNMVDPSTIQNGYINQVTGVFAENANHRATDYIEVVPGTTYGLVGPTTYSFDIRYCWYNESKARISGEIVSLSSINYLLTAPTGAKYIRFSASASNNYQPYYFAPAQSRPVFEAYGSGYILKEYLPEEDLSDLIINLPSKVYAYVGYELNIYFENIVEDWTKYHWDVTCTKGRQMERGFNITPTASDVGTYTLTITAYVSDNVQKSVTTSLIIAATNAGSGTTKKVIILGDSTTNNGIAVTKLNENFSSDVMNISTLGTRGTAPNNHEGRSGWRFSSYFEESTDPGVDNPFYNPTSQTFDASYYFSNSGIAIPDWFFINLGINDTFGYGNDTALESGITTIMSQCAAMIASVKSASNSIKIGLCLTIPPNHSQDAFGKAYKCGQTRDRYKRNNVIWVSKLIEAYDGKERERIYLIPIYTNLDTVNNMGMEALPVNARNTSVTYQSPIENGGVHPVDTGYWQIADVYTAFLKAMAE